MVIEPDGFSLGRGEWVSPWSYSHRGVVTPVRLYHHHMPPMSVGTCRRSPVSRFRHPYLTRGVVHTSAGAFAVRRGIVEAPDAVGQTFGWDPVEGDDSPDRLSGGPARYATTTEAEGLSRDVEST